MEQKISLLDKKEMPYPHKDTHEINYTIRKQLDSKHQHPYEGNVIKARNARIDKPVVLCYEQEYEDEVNKHLEDFNNEIKEKGLTAEEILIRNSQQTKINKLFEDEGR